MSDRTFTEAELQAAIDKAVAEATGPLQAKLAKLREDAGGRHKSRQLVRRGPPPVAEAVVDALCEEEAPAVGAYAERRAG